MRDSKKSFGSAGCPIAAEAANKNHPHLNMQIAMRFLGADK
jgi:hypothetical protein